MLVVAAGQARVAAATAPPAVDTNHSSSSAVACSPDACSSCVCCWWLLLSTLQDSQLTVANVWLSTHLPWLYPLQPDACLKVCVAADALVNSEPGTRQMLPSPATLSSTCSKATTTTTQTASLSLFWVMADHQGVVRPGHRCVRLSQVASTLHEGLLPAHSCGAVAQQRGAWHPSMRWRHPIPTCLTVLMSTDAAGALCSCSETTSTAAGSEYDSSNWQNCSRMMQRETQLGCAGVNAALATCVQPHCS